MLQNLGMMDSKPMKIPMITKLKKLRSFDSILVDPTSYRNLVGSLMYLVNIIPNILFSINVIRQFHMEPHRDHWISTKKILRCLRGTIHHYLRYYRKEI